MTPKQIGAAVRKARGQRSIREVAGAAGLHRDQVTSIEQGTTAYTINSLLALCKVVGLRLAFQARTVGLLVTALLAAGLFQSCGEKPSEMHDRWMSELDCPVVLVAKTDKAVLRPSVVVRDGAGRVRTLAYGSGDFNDGWKIAAAIADSREVGDTLKPCLSPCR